MQLSRNRAGEIFIAVEALLWAAFPIVIIATYQFLPPIHTLAYATLIASVFFGFWFFVKKGWRELKCWKAWRAILLATFFIAILFYCLFFWGLQLTSAGNAAILSQMELWFSFVFFGLILRKEKYTYPALLGALLMFLGVLLVLSQNFKQIAWGDLIIFCSTMIPPIGNHFQQTARKYVATTTLLFVRDLVGGVFLIIFAYLIEPVPAAQNFWAALPLLLLNGVLLLGVAKIFWIEGIHRLPVAKALSMNTITPLYALFYAYLFLRETPQLYQLLSLLPMLAGSYLILNKKFLREEEVLD